MTSEIVIMNKSGVSLAADSALTIGNNRVWKSTNKLFHLDPHIDIAVMFYGCGDFSGIPWEVIVKEYRKSLRGKIFPHVESCLDDFLIYLRSLPSLSEDDERRAVRKIFIDCLDEVDSQGRVNGINARKRKILSFTTSFRAEIEKLEVILSNLNFQNFVRDYRDDIKELIENILKISPSKKLSLEIERLCFEAVRRDMRSSFNTGVVFAGFGEREILPVSCDCVVDGVVSGETRVYNRRVRDLNKNPEAGSYVFSFAQSDIVYMFMEGASSDTLEFIDAWLEKALERKTEQLIKAYVAPQYQVVERSLQSRQNEKLIKKLREDFSEFRGKYFARPVMKVVSSLPKEEMAAMAEALVEITSLRRKMDSSLESVGGPVDVAIVSKGDGFVWVKRKHYFDIDLNSDFMVRRAGRCGRGDG